MRQKCIPKGINAFVAARVRPHAAFGQREGNPAALDADAILAVVQKRDAVGGLAEIGIFVAAHLELSLLQRIVAGGGALDAAELDLLPGGGSLYGGVERGFQKAVRSVPFQFGVDFHKGTVGVEDDVLPHNGTAAHGPGAAHAVFHRPVGRDHPALQHAVGPQLFHAVRVDVPAVPRGGDILGGKERVKGQPRAQLAAGAPVDKGGNGAAGGKTHQRKGRFQPVAAGMEGRGCFIRTRAQ